MCLAPLLRIGQTEAIFQVWGKVPVYNLKLSMYTSGGYISYLIYLIKVLLKPSIPGALPFSRLKINAFTLQLSVADIKKEFGEVMLKWISLASSDSFLWIVSRILSANFCPAIEKWRCLNSIDSWAFLQFAFFIFIFPVCFQHTFFVLSL